MILEVKITDVEVDPQTAGTKGTQEKEVKRKSH